MEPELLQAIQQAVADGRYRVTDHAFEELEDESFHVVDAESAIQTGRIVRIQPAEPEQPGPRYTVVGHATDLMTKLAVVCRFDKSETVLVITAYEFKK